MLGILLTHGQAAHFDELRNYLSGFASYASTPCA
jgi:hypothetical protein